MDEPTPKNHQIVEQISRLIRLVNERPTGITRPDQEPAATNLAGHLSWDQNGELAVD